MERIKEKIPEKSIKESFLQGLLKTCASDIVRTKDLTEALSQTISPTHQHEAAEQSSLFSSVQTIPYLLRIRIVLRNFFVSSSRAARPVSVSYNILIPDNAQHRENA
jgi:hypothetical protein